MPRPDLTPKVDSAKKNLLMRYLKLSFRVAKKSLPDYSNKYSPQRFTQPQLMACLLLREYMRIDLRGLQELIECNPNFKRALGLREVPSYATFCRQLGRIEMKRLLRMLRRTLRLFPNIGNEQLAAIDSTGISSSHASLYYLSKTKKELKGFAKLSCVVGLASLSVLAARVHAGPGPNDMQEFIPLVSQAQRRVQFKTIVADRGYDSERLHQYCHEEHDINSIIPHRTSRDRVRSGYFRLKLAKRFPKKIYNQRYKIEGVFSALKRRFGGSLKARSRNSQLKEALLKTIAYNIRRQTVLSGFST